MAWSYHSLIIVDFPFPVARVYEAMIQLENLPKWTTGLERISQGGVMTEGLQYEAVSRITAMKLVSKIRVDELVANKVIVLANQNGVVHYRVRYDFVTDLTNNTRITCQLEFEFSNIVFDLAQSVIETMARDRLQSDLERLRELLVFDRL